MQQSIRALYDKLPLPSLLYSPTSRQLFCALYPCHQQQILGNKSGMSCKVHLKAQAWATKIGKASAYMIALYLVDC